MTPLFVYGSLMAGEESDGFLNAFDRQPASCKGTLFMMPSGYPALVPSEVGIPIRGELVQLPDFKMLHVLDHFERVNEGLYLRQEIRVSTGASSVPAWGYVLTADLARRRHLRKLDVDDWRKLRAY